MERRHVANRNDDLVTMTRRDPGYDKLREVGTSRKEIAFFVMYPSTLSAFGISRASF